MHFFISFPFLNSRGQFFCAYFFDNLAPFPASYIIDRMPDGSKINKTDQVAACGNSVSPEVARAIVSELVPEMAVMRRAAE